MASLAVPAAEKDAVAAFRRDVVEPSMTKLVIIDFWAEWCGPCKALSPLLDKIAAAYADKGVLLAKIDTDKNKFIAAQFQIRSIPTVYAMFQGQLVADLTPARTESQLRTMLDDLLKQLPIEAEPDAAADIEPLIAMGNEVLDSGDAARALGIFEQIAEIAPDHPAVLSGRIRALVAAGDHNEAESAIAALPDGIKDAGIDQAKARLALARAAPPAADHAALAAEVAAHPDDHARRFALASAQMAAGERDSAADNLLHIIAADRAWDDGAAKAHLLKLFEAVGMMDPWVSAQRRRLSAVLFQ